MATKLIRYAAKISAVVFTSILAPVVVNIAVRDINKNEVEPPRGLQQAPPPGPTTLPVSANSPVSHVTSTRSETPAAAKPLSPEVIQVVVQGAGKTPPEALQDALRTALYRAAASLDDPTLTRSGHAFSDEIARNNAGLIRGWRELGASKEWKLLGTVHHKELAVEVNRQALLERLRTGKDLR